jgi:hypothetical protein
VNSFRDATNSAAHRDALAMTLARTLATPLARFAPSALPHHPVRQQTTPTATSESRKGLSGANPRHRGLTAPARERTGIAATPICLCLRVFHNHLRRWGLVMSRGATARVRHDFPTTHNAALRPYSRGRTHSGPRRS